MEKRGGFFDSLLAVFCTAALSSIIFVIGHFFLKTEGIVLFQNIKGTFWGLVAEVILDWNKSIILNILAFIVLSVIIPKSLKYLFGKRNQTEQSLLGITFGIAAGVAMSIFVFCFRENSVSLSLSFWFILTIGGLLAIIIGMINFVTGIKFALVSSIIISLIIGLLISLLNSGFLAGLIGVVLLFIGLVLVISFFVSIGSYLAFINLMISGKDLGSIQELKNSKNENETESR